MADVELDKVSVTFRITRYGPVSFRDWLCARLAPRFGDCINEVHALKNVSLRLDHGDRVGIVGRNGAGKSTLLKVLAGIYPPTTGRRRVEGRISSLFNILLGFEPDATGWENIRYRGYLQGESRASLRAKMKAIADFSELGPHLDTPVRYYSTGMRMRLGFSIATAIEPEILLVDEALSAGDLYFREKAKARIRAVMSSASIVVAVSHDHSILKGLCDRLIWLDQGTIQAEGSPDEVIRAYETSVSKNKPIGFPPPRAAA